jgi:hypothetical protein
MNIKQKKMEKILKRTSLGVFSVALVAGVIFGIHKLNIPNIEKEKDYLAEFLKNSEIKKSNLTADFLTGTINPYDGPEMSQAVKDCMLKAPKSLNEGVFYGKVDFEGLVELMTKKKNGEFSNKDIISEINDVFGYAMRNSQINWDWIPDETASEKSRYEFYVTPGTENMWRCYFETVEADQKVRFFSSFFEDYPKSYYADINLPSNGKIIDGHARRGHKIEITSKTEAGEETTCATVVREDDTWFCNFQAWDRRKYRLLWRYGALHQVK